MATFAKTGWNLSLDTVTAREIALPSADAVAWDCPAASTNAVISSVFGVWCYCEIKLTGRKERKHTGGITGYKARIRFTDADDTGDWHDAVMWAAK